MSIGDALLYQSYFVCLYEKPNSTLIEYGKSLGTSDGGDIYLTHLDANDPLPVRFYAFGNMDKVVKYGTLTLYHVTSQMLIAKEALTKILQQICAF